MEVFRASGCGVYFRVIDQELWAEIDYRDCEKLKTDRYRLQDLEIVTEPPNRILFKFPNATYYTMSKNEISTSMIATRLCAIKLEIQAEEGNTTQLGEDKNIAEIAFATDVFKVPEE